MKTLDVQVQDQFDQVYTAKATLKDKQLTSEGKDLDLTQRIEHIEINDETILPSTELLFESKKNNRIYKIKA